MYRLIPDRRGERNLIRAAFDVHGRFSEYLQRFLARNTTGRPEPGFPLSGFPRRGEPLVPLCPASNGRPWNNLQLYIIVLTEYPNYYSRPVRGIIHNVPLVAQKGMTGHLSIHSILEVGWMAGDGGGAG